MLLCGKRCTKYLRPISRSLAYTRNTLVECGNGKNYTRNQYGTAVSQSSMRPFEDIPEAKGLPLLGTLLDYTPCTGFSIEYVFDLWRKRHKEYGSIYKEKTPGTSKHVVYCCSEQDVAAMFRYDGKLPNRDTVPVFSRIKKKLDLPESFFNLNGKEWYKFRKVINPLLLKNKMVWRYADVQQEVCRDLVEYIRENLDENGEVPNFATVLNKWSLEMSGTFVLDTRLGLLGKSSDPKLEKLIEWNEELFSFLANSLHGMQLWRYFDTKDFMKAVESLKNEMEYMNVYARPIIQEHAGHGGRKEPTILQQIMNSPDLTEDERFGTLVELFLGAIDTTSKASALAVYCLTLNPESQEKLRKEIQFLVKSGDVNSRKIGNLKYMNAYLKEVFRLYPFSFVFSRWYETDVVLSGYTVPAGTSILNTANSTQNRNPKYFPDPDSFKPERWLKENNGRSSPEHKNVLTGPFGFGARACPGRQFSLQEIRLLLLELLQSYRIEYHHEPIASIFRATGAPSEEPQFKFIPIK